MDNIDQLVQTLSRDVTAVKRAPHPFLLSLKWLALAAAYLAVSLAVSGVRADLPQKLHEPWFLAEIIVLFAIFLSTALSAAVLAFPDAYQKRGLAFIPVWLSGLFVLVMLKAWSIDNPPSPLPVHSFECTLSIIMMSFLPAIAIFHVMRKFASTHQRLSGSIAVLFAFSIGALWLRLYENTDSIIHLVEWHYLPLVAFSAAGVWLGKVLLKW